MHPFCLRHLPRRGKSALCFLVESCGTLLSIHSAPAKRGKGGAVRHQRGEPPKVANHQNGNLADDSKGSEKQTSPRPEGPSPLSIQPAAAGGHNPQPRSGCYPSPYEPFEPARFQRAEPSEPSRRRRALSAVSPQVCISSPPVMMTMAARWNQMKRTTRPIREP